MAHVYFNRGKLIESMHEVHAVVTDASGRVTWSAGEARYETFWRSGAKPFQVLPFVGSGGLEQFGLTDRELAVMVSSHSGDILHIEIVTGILRKLGLSEKHLCCGVSQPLDAEIAKEMYRRGDAYTALHNDCSGKHAGMLGLALLKGFSLEKYSLPAHPVQVLMRQAVARSAGISPESMGEGIDGCGVPTFYLPLYNMALAYARLGDAAKGGWEEWSDSAGRVRAAMAANPDCVGGRSRFETVLMQITCGRLVAKLGAEAGFCIADNTGLGMAYKVADGGNRALAPFGIAVLDKLGWITAAEKEELMRWFPSEIFNDHRQCVGSIAVSF